MRDNLLDTQELFKLSHQYLQQEKYAELINIQTQILTIAPGNAGALKLRVMGFVKQGKYKEATLDCTQLINTVKSLPKPLLAQYLAALKVSFKQELYNIYLERGFYFCCLKNFKNAIEDFEKAKSFRATPEVESLLAQAIAGA